MTKKNNCSPCRHLIIFTFFRIYLFILWLPDSLLNSSFNLILLLFFLCMLCFILLHFYSRLNIVLHLTFIYANSFNFLLTWKWPNIGRNVFFYLYFYCVKFLKKPHLIARKAENSSISIGKHSDSGDADTAVKWFQHCWEQTVEASLPHSVPNPGEGPRGPAPYP